uniref:Uncharacterized protein n=1 Tax=Candidatus Kentrum sp. LFY TaxID=2126342 RepID=A0A450V811_9GAMM|nr:MAG: hypothetical protein BECKLFY1418B_GA0070995_12161 [Candidatus Kentron sp. LFY]
MPLRGKFLKALVFYPEQITSRPIPPDDERSRVGWGEPTGEPQHGPQRWIVGVRYAYPNLL